MYIQWVGSTMTFPYMSIKYPHPDPAQLHSHARWTLPMSPSPIFFFFLWTSEIYYFMLLSLMLFVCFLILNPTYLFFKMMCVFCLCTCIHTMCTLTVFGVVRRRHQIPMIVKHGRAGNSILVLCNSSLSSKLWTHLSSPPYLKILPLVSLINFKSNFCFYV